MCEVRWPGLGALFWRSLKVSWDSMQSIKIMSSERRALMDASDQQWQQRAGRSNFGSLFTQTCPRRQKQHLNFRLAKSQIVQRFLETPPSGSLVLKEAASENLPTGDTLSDSNEIRAAHLMSHLMLTHIYSITYIASTTGQKLLITTLNWRKLL